MRVIDVDESVPAVLAARWVLAEAHNSDGEDQVVYRAGMRRVPRLQRCASARRPAPEALDPDSAIWSSGRPATSGPQLIEQLAAMGAATIVAVSRNPGSRLDELARRLAERGTTLVTAAADASDEASLSALFDRFGADLPPLGGIYLAALGGGPVTLREMTDDDVVAMFRPKMDAVSLLHKLSLEHPVRQFVLFSSISGVLGSRWLAHYAATTTFLDTFAYARRAAGLPASAINWGLWKSLADVQTGFERQVTLESGLEPMPDAVAIQPCVVRRAPTPRSAPPSSPPTGTGWRRRITPEHRCTSSTTCCRPNPTATAAVDVEHASSAKHCANANRQRRHDLLTDHVSAQVAAAMGLASPQMLDSAVGFFQFGMDSLMSVTLQRSLSESLGEVLPASVVFDYPTVEALSDYLATILPEIIETADPEGRDIEDAYDDLAEDELLQKLSERLS